MMNVSMRCWLRKVILMLSEKFGRMDIDYLRWIE